MLYAQMICNQAAINARFIFTGNGDRMILNFRALVAFVMGAFSLCGILINDLLGNTGGIFCQLKQAIGANWN